MASRSVDELPSDTKNLQSVSEQLSRCCPDEIAGELQPDTMNATVKSQKSGKFRRTALTFFGVRKGICILPSFFGGRNKNQNKWSSKKGIGKSKTHDGLCKVSHDDGLRSGYASAGDFEYYRQRDTAGELHGSCRNECSHPAAEQKSLTLGRQKKGLRSLFNSFKHHRNHRNDGLAKTEVIAMSSPHSKKEVPVVRDINQFATECLGSESNVPDFADVICDISIGPECSEADVQIALESSIEKESPKSEFDDQVSDDQLEEMNLIAVVSGDYEEPSRGHSEPCLKLQMTSEPSEMPAGSTDQLDMIFGDVASLKSFDSLTGCGDIIADQEDDSITESTVSGERSRNGGKRASCYLTYQGGGEEMASPEDLDETCLQDFWGNNTSKEICCTCSQDHTDVTAELTTSHNMDLLNSSSTQQAGGMDSSSIADVLTPQSEHQESVPNSDEGYYDSTTPGPEEGREKTDRFQTDRLPRDSYSGDALYELFAPDESLVSPNYENKSKLPISKQGDYSSQPADVTDSAFVIDMNKLQISAELYKVHDLLEMTSTCSDSLELAHSVVGRQEIAMNKNCNLNSKPQASIREDNVELDIFAQKGNMLASSEKRCINADTEKRQSSLSFQSTSDPDFETFCEPKEEHLEENMPVALPYRNITSQSQDSNIDMEDGQTVCFSQALVDFTKHTQMLSNLHNSVDDLETSSAITPNVEALPTIVTFDVVDMHNEGEYDEQIHMELEEDISSPYQEFEESYLQKDAFAECDYQMLDLYEQNMISNTWAVASLPRHLGLTRVSQSMPNPLSLERRSRSLDTESLELKMPETYRENRAAIVSCPQTEEELERDSSPYYKKNVVVSASEVRDSNNTLALSWQTESEMALSLPLTDAEFNEKMQRLSQENVIPCLLRLEQANNLGLRAAVREALALVGYHKPVKGRGIRILSIDGGGVRGILALQTLQKLEALTGKPTYKLFDYICGVSTGAVLGFMLGVFQVPVKECDDLYRKLGSDIFKQNVFVGTVKMGWSHAFYDSEAWESILKEKMGSHLMVETSRNPDCPKVAAVSTIVNRGTPLKAYVFRNYNLLPGVRSHYLGGSQHQLWQAIRATSAAPGYFQEFPLGNDLHQDGGLLINNPTALAIHECQCLWPNTPLECVVSLGTGRFESPGKSSTAYTSLKTKLTNVISSATDTEEVHAMLDAFLPPDTYFRFNPYMSEDISLDENRQEKLNALQAEGIRYLERNEEKLNKAARILTREKSSLQRMTDWARLRVDMHNGLPFYSSKF